MKRIPSMKLIYSSVIAAASAAAFAFPLAANAQPAYPSKPVLLILPLGAGSASDFIVRTLTDRLSTALKQQVVVQNLPGAGGTIGAERGAKAAPDGYTLTALNNSTMTVAPHVYRKVGFDPFKSFTPITMLATFPTILVVHPSMPVKSVKELIALAKARPGQILYSSGGVGSPQHIAMAMFTNLAGVDLVHVPHRTAPGALVDVVAGHVQALFTGLSAPLPHLKPGRLRALAMAGSKRSALVPDVPTMREAGVPGYVFDQWLAFLAPAGTPDDVVNRLNSESVKILAMQNVRDMLTQQSLDPQGGPPEDVTKALSTDFPRMAKIIQQAGIKPE
jgi:tripartite-type tricarboxylate transporter receptor subunit TctC